MLRLMDANARAASIVSEALGDASLSMEDADATEFHAFLLQWRSCFRNDDVRI